MMGNRLLMLWLLMTPSVLTAERARSAADATAFIRVVGVLRAEYKDVWERSVEEKEVELGTGSGFVISPYGHVLTNHHVISGEEITRTVNGVDVEIQLNVERIEVVFPEASLVPEGGDSRRRFVASVDAVDPDLDLAVLSVSGAGLPYIAMGDSDVAGSGQLVQALGFPFGRQVEVGRASVPDIVPRASTTNGAISAKRTGDDGGTRYLQTTAKVNPGNSGGPLVDEEGFALGVIRMKLKEADGIGFAIPVNLVKDFLEQHGLDQLLPVRRMRLGPFETLPGKGVALRLPEGQEDLSPRRLRVDTDSQMGAPLVLDRVATPWSLDELEGALISGRAFDGFRAREAAQRAAGHGNERAVMGRVRGVDASGATALIMEYLLVDLGDEKLVARFTGPEEQIVFNASVLRGSFASLEAERLLTREIEQPLRLEWDEAPLPSPGAPHIVLPAGWVREEGAPFPCQGVPAPDSALAVSPERDFTVSFLVAWWKTGPDPFEAASACGAGPGALGTSSYAAQKDYLGITYLVEGIFLRTDNGLLQLELLTPTEKHELVYPAFREWVFRNREPK